MFPKTIIAHMQTSRKRVHSPLASLEIRGSPFCRVTKLPTAANFCKTHPHQAERSFLVRGDPWRSPLISLPILRPSSLIPSSPMSITGLVGISVGTSIVENAEYVNLGVGWVGNTPHTKQVNVDWRVLGTDISRWC